MEVILLENIRNLGKFGNKVKVAKGFGRNYLIPQGKAVPATGINLAQFEERRVELEKAAQSRLEAAQSRAQTISSVTLKLTAKASEEGKLYGSIGPQDIAKAFKAADISVSRNEIKLPEGPIREIGEYAVEVQLHAEVMTEVKINILPEKK